MQGKAKQKQNKNKTTSSGDSHKSQKMQNICGG